MSRENPSGWGVAPLIIGIILVVAGFFQEPNTSGTAIAMYVIGGILILIGAAMLGILGAIAEGIGAIFD